MSLVRSINNEKIPTKVNIQLSDSTLFGIPAKEYCYDHKEENQDLLTYNRWTIIDLTVIILSWTYLRKYEKNCKSVIKRLIKSIRLP